MATTGGRGGGKDWGREKGGCVGRQMVPQRDKWAVGEGQGQRCVDVSDDLEDSSSLHHFGSEELHKRTGDDESSEKKQKTQLPYSVMATCICARSPLCFQFVLCMQM